MKRTFGIRMDGTSSRVTPFVGVLVVLAASMAWATAQDLSISMSDSPDPADAGDLITYVIDFANAGASASNAVVQLPTPVNTVVVSSEILSGPGWATISNANPVRFEKVTTVGAPESAQFQVRVKIGNSVSPGTIITATSTATTDSSDPVPGNNSATSLTTVSASADLVVNLADTPDPVDPGNNLVYNYTIANFGPSDATNVVVTLPVPSGTTFVQAVGPVGGTWTLGAPPAGQTGDVTFSKALVAFQEGGIFQLTVNVNNAATGMITGQLFVSSDTAEAAPGDETATATTTVNATGPEPCAFTVLKPNGGQTWTIGDKRPLRWDSTGLCCEYVRIQLWQNGQMVKNIKKSTPNDGKASWLIRSPKFSPGTNYKVRIYCPGDNASQDFSNGTFTLVAP